jgi:hypothetical protein
MHRYQCPKCQGFHDRDKDPRCHVHGFGYSPRCGTCVHLAAQPCQGGVR